MDDDTTDRALYEKDLQELDRAAREALLASTRRALTEDEAVLIAWRAGILDDFYKEIRQ